MKWHTREERDLNIKVKKKKKSRRTCLERSQLKTLFDVIRKKRKCNAATEFIAHIDAEFEPSLFKKKKTKRRKTKEFWEGWL